METEIKMPEWAIKASPGDWPIPEAMSKWLDFSRFDTANPFHTTDILPVIVKIKKEFIISYYGPTSIAINAIVSNSPFAAIEICQPNKVNGLCNYRPGPWWDLLNGLLEELQEADAIARDKWYQKKVADAAAKKTLEQEKDNELYRLYCQKLKLKPFE